MESSDLKEPNADRDDGRAERVLFVFLDGVGLGEPDPRVNAFAASPPPVLSALLGGPEFFEAAAPRHASKASMLALDAQLGIEGLPQSGTGQTALLTGRNAPRLFGRHYGPWTPTALRGLVAEENLLVRALRAGRRVAFANAYPEEVFEATGRDRRRRRIPLLAAPALAADAAGLLSRHTPELERGDAIASEITNDGWRENLGRLSLPEITAEQAGRNLARIAAAHDLTLYAHYASDAAGHRQELDEAIRALLRIDAFLGGVLAALPEDILLVVASDHGNLEDARTGHTRNPALALVAGAGHRRLAERLERLTDVAPAILDWIGVSHAPVG